MGLKRIEDGVLNRVRRKNEDISVHEEEKTVDRRILTSKAVDCEKPTEHGKTSV